MRVETIRHPFEGAAADAERRIRANLAALDDSYRAMAQPYVDQLLKLELSRRVSHFVVTEPGDTHPAYLDRLIEASQPLLVPEEDDGR